MAVARDEISFTEIETLLLRQATADPEGLGGALILFNLLPARCQAALITAIEQLPAGEDIEPAPAGAHQRGSELAISLEDLTRRVDAVVAFVKFVQRGHRRPSVLLDVMLPAMEGCPPPDMDLDELFPTPRDSSPRLA